MQHIFSGTLTNRDAKQHIEHRFDVPDDATQIEILFEYTLRHSQGKPQLSLSVFDPEKARGARHNNIYQHAVFTNHTATPGFTAGKLVQGAWSVDIDTHRILPSQVVDYTITIDVNSDTLDQRPAVWPKGHTAPRGAGWYRGDLHGHSLHSDGSWGIPEFVQFARQNGYDFVTLTDHNTVSGLPQWYSLSDDQILTMGGMELTTFYGHCLALGTQEWQEWRIQDGRAMTDIAKGILDSGAVFAISHPMSEGDPVCPGCRWLYEDMMPGIATVVEIWNEPAWSESNEQALQLYYNWLNEGHRLVAISGSDIHGKPKNPTSRIALNVVYAHELSEAAILDGIRRGQVYLSNGPVVEFTATIPTGEKAEMGGCLKAGDAAVHAVWDNCDAADRVRFIIDGKVHAEESAQIKGDRSWDVNGDVKWCLLEIRDTKNELRAVTNPIFWTQ